MKYLKGNFLPLRTFRDLADLNAQARAWVLEEAGVRCHGTTRRTPLQTKALPSDALITVARSLGRTFQTKFFGLSENSSG
ncbi:hypothetical protein [Roseateles sp. LYH14W]|uniref:Uncharacterized protein n=1 Tax=Pelomonas parva TaxID=3299032 RepID=A0ABW7F883_9BURK